MHLMQLQISDFRNLRNVDFGPSEGLNLICGKNASGKTSLLESIYYLSHLRSFRSSQIPDLINRNAVFLQLVARINQQNEIELPIGIRRSQRKLEVRVNRQPINRAADIAVQFPVQAIHPDSYKLITGSPSLRRQFLDWGVFHVEHGFFDAWQRYKRALVQRNAALKTRQDDKYCSLWDQEMQESAGHIDRLRATYLLDLQPYVETLISLFFPGQRVEISYRRGWARESTFGRVLSEGLKKDRIRGFTQQGPHRADLMIRVDENSAQNGISRGQQKVLVALLRLAQVKQFMESTGRNCILLFDDLAAELDADYREKILSVLAEIPTQIFLTAIETSQLDLLRWQQKKMFHVEQGKLKELI